MPGGFVGVITNEAPLLAGMYGFVGGEDAKRGSSSGYKWTTVGDYIRFVQGNQYMEVTDTVVADRPAYRVVHATGADSKPWGCEILVPYGQGKLLAISYIADDAASGYGMVVEKKHHGARYPIVIGNL